MRTEKDGVTYETGENDQTAETMDFVLLALYLESIAFIRVVYFCRTWLGAGAVAYQKNFCVIQKSRRFCFWIPTAFFLIMLVGWLVPLLLFPGLSIFLIAPRFSVL